MRKMSRLVVSACGRDPPFLFFVSRETCTCDLWPVASACGLWCVLVGGTHPYFLFLPLLGTIVMVVFTFWTEYFIGSVRFHLIIFIAFACDPFSPIFRLVATIQAFIYFTLVAEHYFPSHIFLACCLRAGGILPALLFLVRNFSHLRTQAFDRSL